MENSPVNRKDEPVMKSDASGTVKDETKTDKPLVGVGGWLAFFIIALMLIGPLYSIQELASEFRTLEAGGSFLTNHPAYIQMKWFCWIMLFLWIGLREWTGYLLLHRHVWKTVRITIAVLWLGEPVILVLGSLYVLLNYGPGIMGFYLMQGLEGIFLLVVGAAIWTAYLLLSVRVRNTYVREPIDPIVKG